MQNEEINAHVEKIDNEIWVKSLLCLENYDDDDTKIKEHIVDLSDFINCERELKRVWLINEKIRISKILEESDRLQIYFEGPFQMNSEKMTDTSSCIVFNIKDFYDWFILYIAKLIAMLNRTTWYDNNMTHEFKLHMCIKRTEQLCEIIELLTNMSIEFNNLY